MEINEIYHDDDAAQTLHDVPVQVIAADPFNAQTGAVVQIWQRASDYVFTPEEARALAEAIVKAADAAEEWECRK